MPKNTLNHTIQDFIVHLQAAGRASSTIECYQRDLERLASMLRNKRVSLIRDRHLEGAVVKIGNSSRNGAVRSAATMNRIKSAYRSFFQWLLIQAGLPGILPLVFISRKLILDLRQL